MKKAEYMQRAIELAQKGAGWSGPNPLVGAVIVKEGRVIGEGYHARRGEAHAERNALAACREDPAGATIYVTLEPCCHHGKTPPCTDAILAAKLARVVIGSRDPNPKVAGQGAAILREHGIAVEEDFMRETCDALNPIFFHYIMTKTPYVALKYAMTADGKIATRSGASQWITGEDARAHVQSLRNRYRAILVGSGTVLADDPLLNCRLPGGRNPLRVVCDRRLSMPLESRLCQTAGEIPTLIATHAADPERRAALEALGVTVLDVPLCGAQLDLQVLLERLGEMEIDSVLVEGGAAILGSFLERRLFHRLYCYVAPKLFGGAAAMSPIGGAGVSLPAEALLLEGPKLQLFDGGDLLLDYTVKEAGPCSPEL